MASCLVGLGGYRLSPWGLCVSYPWVTIWDDHLKLVLLFAGFCAHLQALAGMAVSPAGILCLMSQALVSPSGSNDDFRPYETVNDRAGGRFVLLCDHASNRLPDAYGTLGVSPSDLERHIGWDIGAAEVTRRLAAALAAPAVLSGFSRLLIDPNRGADDPTLVMKLSDGAIIPGNRAVDAREVDLRRARYWQPYQDAISTTLDGVLGGGVEGTGNVPMVVSLHSFTPVWRGHPRPWHAGILWDRDPRLPHALLAALRQEPGLVVGDNEPYSGQLKGDTMYRHCTCRGLPHALIEIRQDLIDTDHGAQEWAERLARILTGIAEAHPEINAVEHFGSHTDDPARVKASRETSR